MGELGGETQTETSGPWAPALSFRDGRAIEVSCSLLNMAISMPGCLETTSGRGLETSPNFQTVWAPHTGTPHPSPLRLTLRLSLSPARPCFSPRLSSLHWFRAFCLVVLATNCLRTPRDGEGRAALTRLTPLPPVAGQAACPRASPPAGHSSRLLRRCRRPRDSANPSAARAIGRKRERKRTA